MICEACHGLRRVTVRRPITAPDDPDPIIRAFSVPCPKCVGTGIEHFWDGLGGFAPMSLGAQNG